MRAQHNITLIITTNECCATRVTRHTRDATRQATSEMRRNFDAAHNAQQSNGSNDHACVQNSRKYRAATLLRRKRRQRTRRVQRCLRELRRRDAFGPGWRPHSPLSSVGRMPHRTGLPPSCPCDRMRRSTLSAGATARCRRDAFNAVCGNSADAMRLARDGDPIRLCRTNAAPSWASSKLPMRSHA